MMVEHILHAPTPTAEGEREETTHTLSERGKRATPTFDHAQHFYIEPPGGFETEISTLLIASSHVT